MCDSGWISLHRKIKEHWLWKDPHKLKWWLDILLSVNHVPAKVNIGNQLFTCGRGQTIRSLQTWADEWKTSKDTVRNFFKLLENDRMITTENLKKTTRLTVCKYDSYQVDLHAKQTQAKRKPNDKQTPGYPNNNVDNDNNENNKYSSDFLAKIKTEIEDLDLDSRQIWTRFEKWYQEQEFKQVVRIKEQLTPKQLKKLLESYGATEIKETLTAMENYKKVANYNSVYLTLTNWLKKQTLKVA